ncbi:MAG: hypothetical protein ACR5LG_00905 [Sodalis sp. (in: enterobacteria)]|uniref:hypothetical protein n=1 Tax=Sodalis sp. (in: enterobacteria) TaxID=1898979 RepID=UPI003F2FF1BB
MIDYLNEKNAYSLPINNGKAFTEASLRAALKEHNHILIKMVNGGWAPKVFVLSLTDVNETLKIVTNTVYQTTVYYDNKEVILNTGESLTLTTRVAWHEVNLR